MLILGCDPGASGALALLDGLDLVGVEDMPVMDTHVDAAALGAIISRWSPDAAMVELVGAMPRQGLSSTFKFGVSFGRLTGVLSALHIPVHYVTPGKWKKHFRLSSEKEESRAYAIRMWPSSDAFRRKKDHGRAEAALLARYGHEITFATSAHAGARGAAGGGLADQLSPILAAT